RALLPLRPRARVESAVAPGEVQAVEDDARGHARPAVGDDVAGRELGQRLAPRRVQRTRDPTRLPVDRVRLAPEAGRNAGVDEHEVVEAVRDFGRGCRVAAPLARHEGAGLDRLL